MRKIAQVQFYPSLIEMIGTAKKSIDFYSVSCCFGFYTHGLSTFEQIFRSLQNALARRANGKYLDIRVLVKVDRDSPIDMYAAERLQALQERAQEMPGSRNRIVFRELPRLCRAVQFLVVDGCELLVSDVQKETYNPDLDLVLNTSAPGKHCWMKDRQKYFDKHATLFAEEWDNCVRLNVPTFQISVRRLDHHLSRFAPASSIRDEHDFRLVLIGYLHGLYHQSLIDVESSSGSARIDLLIGERPQHERMALEVKFGIGDDAIQGVVEQIAGYKKEYPRVILLVGKPEYSAKSRRNLINELRGMGVELLEYRLEARR